MNTRNPPEDDFWFDPIVEETRAWGAKLLEEAGGDPHKLWERLIESQKRHGDRLAWDALPEHLRPAVEARG